MNSFLKEKKVWIEEAYEVVREQQQKLLEEVVYFGKE